ncbi:hypothetical protein TWF506_001686 [Arthrobotrys conoides]|uniref:Uncharacterized protein n=1 Tax=Arthrobotrys conoides TaxID=74498 RepID=A0AAN8NN82_9PEZI
MPPITTPDHVAGWMQHNMCNIGDVKINEYMCLPATHDSGMDHHSWSTTHGTKNRTLNQTLGIGNQLRLGARWFDLRPMLLDGDWYCGHFSSIPTFGWQGATGVKLQEVIDEVNEFLDKYPELVILRVTHLHDARTGATIPQHHQQLLKKLFNGLKHIYWGKDKKSENNLDKKTLRDFIGNKVGKVIVTGEPEDGPGFSQGDFDSLPGSRTDFVAHGPSANAEMSNAETFWNSKSLIDLANKRQLDEYPYTPQRIYTELNEGSCGMFMIDNLHDGSLQTICLAMSLARHMIKDPNRYGSIVVVYAGKLITDAGIKAKVMQAIKGRARYAVTNDSMGGDPWAWERKCAVACMVETKHQGRAPFLRARFAWEGEELDFTTDIESINFGGKELYDHHFRTAYYNLFRMLREQLPITPSIEFFGLTTPEDPQPGVVKDGLVYYRSIDGNVLKQRRLREHNTTSFCADVQKLEWEGQIVRKAEAYEPFLWRLDYGGGTIQVTNELMGFDPAPGKRKRALLTYRSARHGPMRFDPANEFDNWTIKKADP